MEKEKFCSDCYHYHRYYVKQSTRFRAVDKGVCYHPKKRVSSSPKLCDNWEDGAERERQRANSVKRALNDIAHRLLDIIEVQANTAYTSNSVTD